MAPEYNHGYKSVNNFSCLTVNSLSLILLGMNFNERLVAARKYAGLTQQQIIDRLPKKDDNKPIMSQANLGKLEKNPNAQGSIYTALIAYICGVDPIWLTTGEGLMVPAVTPGTVYTTTPEQALVVKAMEGMPKSQQENMVKIGYSLTEQATGTEGPTTTTQ